MIFYVISFVFLEISGVSLFSFKYIMIMKLNTYRLSSLEDPTDEQLHALMEQVAVAARERFSQGKREIGAENARGERKIESI